MAGPRVRDLRGVVLALAAMALLGADPTTPGASPTPTDEPARLSDVQTTCRVDLARTAQVVTCDVEGLPPGEVVRLTVETGRGADAQRDAWTGSASADPAGSASPETAVPCELEAVAPVRVAADAAGSYEHRQEVALPGRCRPMWLLTLSEATRLVALLLVSTTLVLAVRARRRERELARELARARRRERSGRTGVSSARGRPR